MIITLLFSLLLVFFSCEDQNIDEIIPSQTLLKTIKSFNEKGDLSFELEFFYNSENYIERSELRDRQGLIFVASSYQRDVQNRIKEIIETKPVYLSPTDYKHITKVSYNDNKITGFSFFVNSTQKGSVTLNYEGDSKKIDTYLFEAAGSNINADVTLDERGNIISVINTDTGKQGFEIGRLGTHNYDAQNSPFDNFDKDMRIIWNFGDIQGKVGEMQYSLGNNNRSTMNRSSSSNSNEVWDFKHTYNYTGKPDKTTILKSRIFQGDTISQTIESYEYIYQ